MPKGFWIALSVAAWTATSFVLWHDCATPPIVNGDSEEYAAIAQHLAAARTLGFEPIVASAGRAPLYPVLLALTSLDRGLISWTRAQRTQAILTVLLAGAAGALGLALHSPAAGLFAIASVGLHPGIRAAAGTIGVETLFAFCLLAVAWAMARRAAEPDAASARSLGLALGVSLWCRSTLVFLPPLLWAADRWGAKRPRGTLWAILLIPYLVLAPWTVRNFIRLGAWVPVERQAGVYNLFHAALGHTKGTGDVESDALARRTIADWDEMDEVQRESALYRTSARMIMASPAAYLVGCLRRTWLLWRVHCWLLAAAGLALWRLRGRREFAALGWLCGYLGIYVLMAVSGRYAQPTLPILCLLAACGLADLIVRPWPPEQRLPLLVRGVPLALAVPLLLAVCAAGALGLEWMAARRARLTIGAVPSCPQAQSRWGPWRFLADAKRAQDRGVLLFKKGELRAAGECLQAALWIEPRYAAARISAGVVLSQAGEQAAALSMLDAAVLQLQALPGEDGLLLSAQSTRASLLGAPGRH